MPLVTEREEPQIYNFLTLFGNVSMKRSSKRFIEYYDVKKGRNGLDNKIFLAIVGNVSIEMLDKTKKHC